MNHTVAAVLMAAAAAVQAQPATALQARSLAAGCAACHGTDGRATTADMPALAGMPAATLIGRLTEFRTGAAPATVMHQIAKGYSDEQLRLIAGYFAQQPAGAAR